MKLNSDKIISDNGKCGFLFRDNSPLVCEVEHTVLPIVRRTRAFLSEEEMYRDYKNHLAKVKERYLRVKDTPEYRRKTQERYLRIKDTPKYKRKMRKYVRKYRETNLKRVRKSERERVRKKKSSKLLSEKQKARLILGYAVFIGWIKRPKKCSICNGSNGRIEGHHPDYLKPLEVEWLCSICHGKKRRIK